MKTQLLEYYFHCTQQKSGPTNLPMSSIAFHPALQNIFVTTGFNSTIMLWQLSCPAADQQKSNTTVSGAPAQSSTNSARYQIKCIKELKSSEMNTVVNCARFSPHHGNFIASGTDGGLLKIWNFREALQSSDSNSFSASHCSKTLQNDSFSIVDLAWIGVKHIVTVSMSAAGSSSGGRCILWDVSSRSVLRVIDDKFKGFLQGCCVDPFSRFIAVQSTNRCSKFYEIRYKSNSKKSSSSADATNSLPSIKTVTKLKTLSKGDNFIFRSDNATMFTRRANWSPDSLLCCMTAGALNSKQLQNAALLFLRDHYTEAICMIPVDDTVVGCAWSPVFYELRNQKEPQLYPLDRVRFEGKPVKVMYRQILAILTNKSVYICDTHNRHPIAIVKNMHLSTLTDASFSMDGMSLLTSSHDGYASIIHFDESELGKPLSAEAVNEHEHLRQLSMHHKTRLHEEMHVVEEKLFPKNESKENNPNILNIRR